jgi:hypothetical protein
MELLISFPLMGPKGRDPGTFEWVVPRLPNVVVYEVDRVRDVVIVTGRLSWCAGPRGRKMMMLVARVIEIDGNV